MGIVAMAVTVAAFFIAQSRERRRLGGAFAVDGSSGLRRELRITMAGLIVTLTAAGLAVADILAVLADRVASQQWGSAATQAVFLSIVGSLIYGACVYHLARLGHLRRLLEHVRASDDQLRRIYDEADPPLVTALVPSYMEDARVVRRTLLCAALQEYPRRRVVLLIDDPPSPAIEADSVRLEAARALPREIETLLAGPKQLCGRALDAFRERQASEALDADKERLALAALHHDVATWFEEQAAGYEIVDHADRLFVDVTFRVPARECRTEGDRILEETSATWTTAGVPPSTFITSYTRLFARFDTELVSFERKRYENVSHAANKAMNLNSYIALLGRRFREQRQGAHLFLAPVDRGPADLVVPRSEFLLIVDADSVLRPDYALRLIHLMRCPGQERVAIAQTPYSAFPGAPAGVERIAGATTDIQYVIHQGFTHYGATYWVGANAVARTAALEDIATRASERGHEITRFVQDQTVIEDTESTVDLLARGWRLHNYPDRLAYSETPPDFGSLLIQRRRWANGGLIILPKLLRHVGRKAWGAAGLLQTLMMAHYLTSLAAVNTGLLIVLAFSFEESMRTLWLPLTALSYYVLYARDLRSAGYRALDVCRVYALNLALIPVNLAGVLGSMQQALTGAKTAFGRTPKVKGGTRVPGIYLVAEYALLTQWLLGILRDLVERHPLHALLTAMNVGFFVYGLVSFVGIKHR
jgi:cellulose synthase/poly-beta-1,6-N-acetylglucosamine synthase-like glycosyltransferase